MKFQKEGFPRQRLYRMPERLVQHAQNLPVCRSLTVTDLGFFPEAAGHRVTRAKGSPTHILMFCVAGRGWVKHASHLLKIHSGQMVWIDAEVPHAYGADPESPWRLYWLHVTGEQLGEWRPWIQVDPNGVTVWSVSDTVGMAERFEHLWRLQDDGGRDLSLLRMSTEAMALLAHALATRITEGKKSRYLEERVEHCIGWMREHLDRQVTLQDCAREAGLSPSHFSAIFKKTTGVAPLKYFTRLRLRKASEWLDGTDWPIQQISDELGYANPFHFSRAFRSFTGLSPRNYRNRMDDAHSP